ncbi:MAG: type II secretion system protein GspM [Propylenella sp.]
MALQSQAGLERIAVLAVGALLLVAPVLWIGWSLAAASEASEEVRQRSETLAALRERIPGLAAGGEEGTAAGVGSPYLPGETAAIAGAVLQRIVADTIMQAGGRLAESEITPAEEGGSSRVDLRVSFDTDINGLQRILFDLETGAPILFLNSLNVQMVNALGEADPNQPGLRVVVLVGGYRTAQP